MLDTDIADLLLKCELLEKGVHSERHTVNDGVVGKITEGDGLAVRRHIFGDVNRLTEDGIAVLIPEVLAVLVLERFQLQSRLVIHEPCAVCTVGLEDGEVQRQNIVKADVPGRLHADLGTFGIVQNASRHIDVGAVDEGGLLSLAETLGELDHKVSFQIETEVTDEIGFDGGDDSQLVSGHILLRETLCGGGNGAVFGYPRREIIVVGEPDLAVALGGIHNGADPAEEVIFLQGSIILGGSALREQIGVGEAVLAVNEVTVGFVAATHGLPEAVAVAADTGSYVLVVDVMIHDFVLLTDSSGKDTWPHYRVCSSVPSVCHSTDRQFRPISYGRADGRCEA